MGEVYRTNDSKLKREVALKVLPDSFADDPERMARFQREAEMLASLNHRNIAQTYSVEDLAERLTFSAGFFSYNYKSARKFSPHKPRLLRREIQFSFLDERPFGPAPVSSHDAADAMTVSWQQQVADLVRHNMAQDLRQPSDTRLLKLRREFNGDRREVPGGETHRLNTYSVCYRLESRHQPKGWCRRTGIRTLEWSG